MTLSELKYLSSKSKVYNELFLSLKGKKYISEDAFISEEAEALEKEYIYVYLKTRKEEFSQYVCLLQKCKIPSYLTFDEVVKKLRDLQKEESFTESEFYIKARERQDIFFGTKYSTFHDAVLFLNLK